MSTKRTLFLALAVLLVVLPGGCTLNADDPKVFHCSLAEPDCPTGLKCHFLRRECLPASSVLDANVLEASLPDKRPPGEQSKADIAKPKPDARIDGRRLDKAAITFDAPFTPDLVPPKPDKLPVLPEASPCAPLKPPAGLSPSIIVSASFGSDATTNSLCVPYRTITAALKKAVSGDVVWVAPGTYNGQLGEIFPLKLPDGVMLVGDEASSGMGPVPTAIDGTGLAPSTYVVSLYQAGQMGGGSVRGFLFNTPAVNVFALDNGGLPMKIVSNTFACQNGITLTNAGSSTGGCPSIVGNTFKTSLKGIYSQCFGSTLYVDKNTFIGGSMGIYITQGEGVVSNNKFAETAIPIQVDFAKPLLDGNSFSVSSGVFAYGAIKLWGGSPRVRNCTFYSGPALYINDPNLNMAMPDLGTATDPGNNDFGKIPGVVVDQESSTTIQAIGNAWPNLGTICSHIIAPNGGHVQVSNSQTCP